MGRDIEGAFIKCSVISRQHFILFLPRIKYKEQKLLFLIMFCVDNCVSSIQA